MSGVNCLRCRSFITNDNTRCDDCNQDSNYDYVEETEGYRIYRDRLQKDEPVIYVLPSNWSSDECDAHIQDLRDKLDIQTIFAVRGNTESDPYIMKIKDATFKEFRKWIYRITNYDHIEDINLTHWD